MRPKFSYWIILYPFIKSYLKSRFPKKQVREIFKNAKREYKNLMVKSEDIGEDNPMASNLYYSILFFSFLYGNPSLINKSILAELMEYVITHPIINKLNKKDFNNSKDMEKFKEKMIENSKWADENLIKYPSTWKFNFDDSHQDGCYYYFTKCPIAKYFKDNGLEEYTHLFCELDYLTIKACKGKLIRHNTLADGDEICDFWILGDQADYPN